MRAWPAVSTASSRTMSLPPQAPGPIRRGIGSTAAMASSRLRQSDGSAVTPAESKSGPAASRKVCGSSQAGGRGRGKGIVSAAASPQPKTPSKTMARRARTGAMLGTIAAFMRDISGQETIAPVVAVANLAHREEKDWPAWGAGPKSNMTGGMPCLG